MEPLTRPVSLDQVSRRDVFRVAAGLGLSFLLPPLDLRAADRRGPERPKSLITVWLAGGASQLETWDPHPGPRIGGQTRALGTTVPGLQIADLFPRVAECMHRLSVVRSLVSKEGDHERGTYYVKTGYRPDPTLVHPALGAIVTHELPDPSVEIPLHVALAGARFPARGGFLGARFDAFRVFEPGQGIQNMRAAVDDERQRRRVENLDVIARGFAAGRRTPDAPPPLHQTTVERALTMMSSAQLQAFEPEHEPKAIRERYGDSRFGRGCLVARRLVEQGVRAVEVTLDGFDSHTNNHEAHVRNAAMLDPALSALVSDLVERDLLASTVVLCIGEFGRTPRINPLEGRDHWPTGFSCLVGGGGLASGVVLGATDPTGESTEPTDPLPVQDLYATILKTLGVDYAREVLTPIGRPILLSDGTPVPQLLAGV